MSQKSDDRKSYLGLIIFITVVSALVGIGILVHEEKKKEKPLAEDFFKARKQQYDSPDTVPVEKMTNKQKAERSIYLQD